MQTRSNFDRNIEFFSKNNDFSPQNAALWRPIHMLLRCKVMWIGGQKQCFCLNNGWKKMGQGLYIDVILYISTIYKNRSYLAYLRPMSALFTNTSNIRRLVVKKNHIHEQVWCSIRQRIRQLSYFRFLSIKHKAAPMAVQNSLYLGMMKFTPYNFSKPPNMDLHWGRSVRLPMRT